MGVAVALLTATGYTVSRLIQSAPAWIDHHIDERVQRLELERSEVDASAMRDRAIADSITMAASVNSQAMRVIEILSKNLVDDEVMTARLGEMVEEVRNTNKSLNQLIYLYQPQKTKDTSSE